MLTRRCPKCSRQAKPSLHIEHGDVHAAPHIFETLKHSRWLRAHPALAALSWVGFGALSVAKAYEGFHFKCECGNQFKF